MYTMSLSSNVWLSYVKVYILCKYKYCVCTYYIDVRDSMIAVY